MRPREAVFEALAQPLPFASLLAATGLTRKQVANATQQLKHRGRVGLVDGKWQRTDTEATSMPAADAPTRKATGKRAAHKVAAPEAASTERTLCYFLDEDGDIRIQRIDGEGECTPVPRVDAAALFAFLELVRGSWST